MHPISEWIFLPTQLNYMLVAYPLTISCHSLFARRLHDEIFYQSEIASMHTTENTIGGPTF